MDFVHMMNNLSLDVDHLQPPCTVAAQQVTNLWCEQLQMAVNMLLTYSLTFLFLQ